MKTKSVLIFLCLFGGVPFPAPAQERPSVSGPIADAAMLTSNGSLTRVSIRQALNAAWQRAVSRAEANGLDARAKTEREIATNFLAGPPAIEFSQRSDRWHDATGNRENEMGLAMPIWLPGQRTARIASAEAGIRFADATMAANLLRLAGEVREVAWAISAERAEQSVAEDQAAYLRQLAADVARRVDAGDLARSDWLAAEAEALGAASVAMEAKSRLQLVLTRWKLLTGLDAMPDPSENAPARTDNGSRHPEEALALVSQERAKRQADVAATSKWDAPELALKLREDVSATGFPAQRSVGISVRIPLGASERGLTQLAEAQTNRTVAELALLREQDRLRAEATTAKLAVEIAQRALVLEQARAAYLMERASLIEKSFKLGESPLTDLLRAKSAASQAIAARAKQEAAAGLASARLKQAIGELP